MQFKGLIQGLCERLGLTVSETELASSEFVLNADELQVRLSASQNQLVMETVLCPIPESAQAKNACYTKLLEACGTGALNFGTSLALDQDKNHILLFQRFQMHALSILDLEQALEEFLGSIDHYTAAL